MSQMNDAFLYIPGKPTNTTSLSVTSCVCVYVCVLQVSGETMLKWFSGEEAESGSVVSTDVSVFLWTLIVIRVR